MNEAIFGLFGCAIILAIPAALVWVGLKLHRRIGELDARIEFLEARAAAESPARSDPAEAAERFAVATRVDVDHSKDEPVDSGSELADEAAGEGLEAEMVDSGTIDQAAISSGDVVETSDVFSAVPAAAAESAADESPKAGWDERIATRLPVWIGAASFALAAAFLVKLSFDQGWIGPTVRVAIGVLFGLVLLGAGEMLRSRQRYLAQGLTAAGLASLFVAFYASTALYSLVGPVVGFLLLALTAATAVVLSTRQGPMVATIGLIGGFLTPALVGSREPNAMVLFGYLLLLQVGLVVVTRSKNWWWLALLAQLASFGWILGYLGGAFSPRDTPVVGSFLLASVASLAVSLVTDGRAWGHRIIRQVLAWTAVAGGLVAVASLVEVADHNVWSWLFLAVMAAASQVVARLQPSFFGLSWLAAGWALATLAGWGSRLGPGDARSFLITAALFVLVLAGLAGLLSRGSTRPPWWLALSGATSVLGLLVMVSVSQNALRIESVPWGGVALVLAVPYVAAARGLVRPEAGLEPSATGRLAALSVTATTLISLSLPLELEHAWLTVGWAIEVGLLLWIATRLRVQALVRLAEILVALVAIRLLLNPAVAEYPIGSAPVFNWLLYGYGLPILSFSCALLLARQLVEVRLQRALEVLLPLLLTVWSMLTIRHAVHGRLADAETTLIEVGGWTICTALIALGCFHLDRLYSLVGTGWALRLLVAAATVESLLGLALIENPLWSGEPVVGGLLLNSILLAYGGSAAALALVVWKLGSPAANGFDRLLARTGAVAAVLSLFLCVTLEVKTAFRGANLDQGVTGSAEGWAISLSWVGLGLVLAVAAGIRGDSTSRWSSLVVMLIAVVKVFLFDTANLEGFYRVLSLFGLGVSLFVLAYVYQRIFATGDRQDS